MHAEKETFSSSIDDLADRESNCCSVANPYIATVQQQEDRPAPAIVIEAAGLLATDFKPRERILHPWLTTQGLVMIYGPRGIAKTHVAMGIAYALASGGEFLGWKAREPVSVLYIDGEMPGADLKERLARIISSNTSEAPADFLRFITPDLQPDGIMPNLYTPEGRLSINEALGDAMVIIIDNLSALVRGGKENEGESWQPVAEWALRMRSSGRSVIFIHHAGKGGQQRGTSKREDLLDTVIALKRPADYVPDQGARFEIHFEKARALYGQDVTAIEATLHTNADGTQGWTTQLVSDLSEQQMIDLAALGMTVREISAEVGVSYSTVSRALSKAKEEGRYTPPPKGQRKASPVTSHWSESDESEA